MARRGRIKTTAQSWANGTHIDFKNLNIPDKTANGNRIAIDGVTVVSKLSDVTVAGTAIAGEDRWRMIKRLRVTEKGGFERYNLSGEELRWAMYLIEGPYAVAEFADSAVAANQDLTTYMYVPFTKRQGKRGKDYALPSELLENFRVECASATELGVGGGTITINSGSYYLIAHVHEEEDIEHHVSDEIRATPFKTTTSLELKADGWLADLGIAVSGADGGGSMANFTDLRSNNGGPMPTALLRTPDLEQEWERSRWNPTNLNSTQGGIVRYDPVQAGKLVPVFWYDEQSSTYDGPLISEQEFVATNTVASCIAVSRVVKPRNERQLADVERQHGLGQGSWRLKTAGKTLRSFGAWKGREERLSVLPLKAPMAR